MDDREPLALFVRESNWIEGIKRQPTEDEIQAHHDFLEVPKITVQVLQDFVGIIQPDAVLRDRQGLNVRVGDHHPPEGGPGVIYGLHGILQRLDFFGDNPKLAFDTHRQYETLHPFTDGNGRSGRVLWLRMMGGSSKVPLGFLHHWYYQSLAAHR